MNLYLATIEIWSFQDEFAPTSFLRQLRTLLLDGDVIAVGAYAPTVRLCTSLEALGATRGDMGTIYSETFAANRREHPHGRSFEFLVNDGTIEALAQETARTDGQEDKPLFFDHLMAYRRGVPVVPLLCFHDAFSGGSLAVSALYPEEVIKTFAAGLPSAYSRQRNPENYPDGLQAEDHAT